MSGLVSDNKCSDSYNKKFNLSCITAAGKVHMKKEGRNYGYR